jgi:Domain of unknown function (DUF4149)
MSLLRFASLVVLAVWIGGLAVLGGLGAPTIFSVLEAHDPVAGRELAGLVFGAIFERFQHVAWGCGALLLALVGTRAALGPRPRRFGLQMWLIGGMLAASLYSGLVLAPRIDAIRASTPGPIAALAEDNPSRQEFGRLHGWSNGLMGVSLVAGLFLIWWNVRE